MLMIRDDVRWDEMMDMVGDVFTFSVYTTKDENRMVCT